MNPDLAWAVWSGERQRRIEGVLERALPPDTAPPLALHRAMRYAVLGGGKRVRPLLAYAAGELAGAAPDVVDAAGAAVELIHAYSLVHDDLPCMDDDSLRRGKPTCHVAFGEATALLAGDTLQALAFETLARGALRDVGAAVAVLAAAAGAEGMAGGQAIDLDAVGASLDLPALETMHRMKTGALIRAAVSLGAACGAPLAAGEQQALQAYAAAAGLAFQVVDDVLDVEGSAATLGKTAGKDAAQGKPTFVSLLGLAAAKERAESLRVEAHAALAGFGGRGRRLAELADWIVLRRH
ncbi:MAG: polyprenyl synthetase family protein [Betaproteobacteria bacterium]|nr:polyprenyl synthetase family protein [Betaproteobacteria bacterium]